MRLDSSPGNYHIPRKNSTEYLIGVGLAAAVYAFAMVSGFDRERVFDPTVWLVGHYYILFTVVGSSTPVLALDLWQQRFWHWRRSASREASG